MSNNKLFMEGHELAVVNRYYIWLLNRIDFDSYEDRSKLLQYLHNKEYVWDIWTDENRAEDGMELRAQFEKETDYLDYSPLNKPCSVLEMLIAFAERIDKDVTDEEYGAPYWFWIMIDNLGLKDCTDDIFDAKKVNETLDKWLNRLIKNEIKTGIFPVKSGKKSDGDIDCWFQMQKWIAERY